MCVDSVSMCSVFHLHSPDFSACGDGWEAHSAPPTKGAVPLPERALGVLVSW